MNTPIVFIDRPTDFNGSNFLNVGTIQAQSLRFGEEFHFDKSNVFAPYLRAVIDNDRLVEGADLYFEEDGYLFRLVRPSYLNVQLIAFEDMRGQNEDE